MTLVIPDAYERASEETAFSNNSMWEYWAESNCYRCANDGMGIGLDDPQCPLIAVALLGRTPAEWTDKTPPLGDYHCIYFRDRDDPGGREPQPVPEPPGMDALFPREPWTGSRMPGTVTPLERESADAARYVPGAVTSC